ncbi:MAG TPA: HEAT repeat domain-containing protein, partial [Pirellulaceae bacterium]|nr:HEAT repeat domain-containing protein [Pirellulaceae bacterium]
DLSIQLGTPNGCVACHIVDSQLSPAQKPKSPSENRPVEYADWLRDAAEEKPAVKAELERLNQWADAACEKWYGAKRKKEPHFARALLAAREMRPDAQEKLIELLGKREQPAIARATAAAELGAYVNPAPGYSAVAIRALQEALADKSPEVRAAAAESLGNAPPDDVQKLLLPLLADPVRMVRYRAAQALSPFTSEELFSADERTLQTVLREMEAQTTASDRAGYYLMRAGFAQRRGDLAQAGADYETAIDLEPTLSGPRQNLAALLDQLRQPAEGARLRREELDLRERDARRAPQIAALQVQVGLARHLNGWKKEAESALLQASLLEPRNPAMLEYLAIYYRDTGRPDDALALAERLWKLRPGHPGYERMRQELRDEAGR